MSKLLRPQDVLLITLYNILDLFEEVHDPFKVFATSYENMYGFVPSRFKRHNFNHLIWRNLKTGNINKMVKNGIPYLILTSEGKDRISRKFSMLKFQNMKWDGKWRFVTFDIEELNRIARDRFRKKLKELGFGMFQQSVYITPYDILEDFKEFVENKGLSESVYIMEVSKISVGNIRSLVESIWNLDKINDEYINLYLKIKNNYLKRYHGRDNKLNTELNVSEKNKIVKKIYNKYLHIMMIDPYLPLQLLPKRWMGIRVRNLMIQIIKENITKTVNISNSHI